MNLLPTIFFETKISCRASGHCHDVCVPEAWELGHQTLYSDRLAAARFTDNGQGLTGDDIKADTTHRLHHASVSLKIDV